MKYHKIPGVEMSDCTCEQKIAYNMAFAIHIHCQEEYDALQTAAEKNRLAFWMRDLEIKSFRENYPKTRYDIDAIFCALTAGIEDYLKKPFIATDYKTIGKVFPANYLKQEG